MSLGAVLMAAGSGSRMGFKPKCLLRLNGQTLIERLIEALMQAGVDELIVVLGHYHQDIAPFVAHEKAHCVLNPRPDEGQISSQRIGLQALKPTHDRIIMALADQPLIQAVDLEQLLMEFKTRPDNIEMVSPRLSSGPGNPVIISNAVRQDILKQGSNYGCRQWRGEHPARAHQFLSDNPHFVCDVDTLEDVRALETSKGISLTWDQT
ncbi:MAG: nucleotidyltransferase family protein [Betaproteobacteria bacterium]|jgi:CTP:molybdopterin cytidylyltransferase MocA